MQHEHMVAFWGQPGKKITNGHNVTLISPGYTKIAWALWGQHDLNWFRTKYKGKPELGIGVMDWAYAETYDCEPPDTNPPTNIPNKGPPPGPPTAPGQPTAGPVPAGPGSCAGNKTPDACVGLSQALCQGPDEKANWGCVWTPK